MKNLRLLLITLCVSVLMGSMAVTAYAGGGEEWDGLDPVEPPPAETVDPGEGFTEDGNLVTRDLLYDMQLFTILYFLCWLSQLLFYWSAWQLPS